jgi:hypothetical protein
MNDTFTRIASIIEEALLEPDFWSPVLEALTEALGALGVAVILRNKTSGQVERVRFCGPSPRGAGLQADYVNHYSASIRSGRWCVRGRRAARNCCPKLCRQPLC